MEEEKKKEKNKLEILLLFFFSSFNFGWMDRWMDRRETGENFS